MIGFLRRAGFLLGEALVGLGLGARPGSTIITPTPPTGAAGLPTHVRLLSPARRTARLLSPAYRKLKVLGG